jgi:hypothetical protein
VGEPDALGAVVGELDALGDELDPGEGLEAEAVGVGSNRCRESSSCGTAPPPHATRSAELTNIAATKSRAELNGLEGCFPAMTTSYKRLPAK